MKKAFRIFIVLAFLLALFPAMASAHTEDDPLIVDLLAGQTVDIGDVKVWNDGDNLYVEFDSTKCMTETHLAIATALVEIPQKNGNPIPGKFPYSRTYDPCVYNDLYVIPLTWDMDDDLFIAAHAALREVSTMTIVSGDGQTMVTQRRSGNVVGFTPLNNPAVLAWEPGPNYPNDGSDDSGWEANSLWDQNLSIDLIPTGADWIWESYRVLDPIYGTVLTFQRNFNIGYPIAGDLKIACDNGYEVLLNGTSLGSHGVNGDWRNSDLKQGFVPQDGWNAVVSYALGGFLQAGANTLTINPANEYFNTDDPPNPYVGTVSNNPGACIFAGEISHVSFAETAWGDGEDFPGKNWATYFTYTVQSPCTNVPSVVNGGFEVPVVSQGWDIYPSGTTDLGWTVNWVGSTISWGGQTRPDTAVLELHKSGTVVDAIEGNQYAELDTDWGGPTDGGSGEPASVAISQDLATCSGDSYLLSFTWSPRTSTSNLEVFWGGTSLDTFSGGSGWTTSTFTVLASGESTALMFKEIGLEDSLGMFLDDVQIILIP